MNAHDLKQKTLEAIIRGLEADELQASMVAQAINYMKTFREELETPMVERTVSVADLSGSLKKMAAKHGYNA